MSSRYPPWITALVKYLLRKKKRAAGRAAVCKLIGKNWGRNGAEGSSHWWRRADKITLRKQKSQPYLENEFLAGLYDYFGDL